MTLLPRSIFSKWWSSNVRCSFWSPHLGFWESSSTAAHLALPAKAEPFTPPLPPSLLSPGLAHTQLLSLCQLLTSVFLMPPPQCSWWTAVLPDGDSHLRSLDLNDFAFPFPLPTKTASGVFPPLGLLLEQTCCSVQQQKGAQAPPNCVQNILPAAWDPS